MTVMGFVAQRPGVVLSWIVSPGGARLRQPYGRDLAECEKPGDLPVQYPVKYEMAVNLKTAKALGLTVPRSILLRADEVIE